MRGTWLLLAVLALLTAGCIGNTQEPDPGSTAAPANEAATAGSTDGTAPDPAFHEPVNVTKEAPGAEPMLDVGPDGTIYLTGTGPGNDTVPDALPIGMPTQPVLRSTDDGETWTDITPRVPTAGRTGVDNALAVDDGGTVYYVNAASGTLQVFRSTDQGDTWLPALTAPYPNPMHRTWLAPEGESTIHLAVESLATLRNWHHASDDSGTTWGPPTPIHQEPGFGSDLTVGPDGTLFMARTSLVDDVQGNDEIYRLHRSTDGGLTWTTHEMFEETAELTASWQSLEAGPDGTLYMVWAQAADDTSLVHYAYSTDGGETWTEPRALAPVDGSQTLPWMDVRGPGELGVVWYATNQTGLPSETEASWHVDYAFVEDADTPNPTVHRTRVTDRPVHEGVICTEGPFCDGGRELLDFTWVEFGPENRAHLAYASTLWDEPSAFPVYAGETEPWPPE